MHQPKIKFSRAETGVSQTQLHLYYIFTYYCSFGDRQNYEYLKIQNFRRLLTDTQLLPQPTTQPNPLHPNNTLIQQFDLLYTKAVSKSKSKIIGSSTGCSGSSGGGGGSVGMDFMDFLEVVGQIGEIEGEGVDFCGNLEILYEFLRDNTQFGECINFLTKTIYEQSSFLLLRTMSPTLLQIYLHYFDTLIHSPNNTPAYLFKTLTAFTKDFQIIPQLLTKPQAYLIFNYVMDWEAGGRGGWRQDQRERDRQRERDEENVYADWFNDDQGNPYYFRYFHFVQFLLIAAIVSRKRVEEIGVSQVGVVAAFLEVLGVSKGFSKLCKKEHVDLYLIPDQKLISSLQQQPHTKLLHSSTSPSPRKSRLTHTNNQTLSPSPSPSPYPISFSFSSSHTLSPSILAQYNSLHKKFISFCIQGETIGTNYLSRKKAVDVVIGLGVGLGRAEVQVCLVGEGERRGIGFQGFLGVLQKIGEKTDTPIEQIVNNLLALDSSPSKQAEPNHPLSLTRKQYRNCTAMIQLLQPLLSKAFTQQCTPQQPPPFSTTISPKIPPPSLPSLRSPQSHTPRFPPSSHSLSLLSLPGYLKLMHSFQLSPLYLSKQTLVQVFRKSIRKGLDFMNFQEWKDSFIIAGKYLGKFGDRGQTEGEGEREGVAEERMILMFERINQSRGAKKLARKMGVNGDFLVKFRNIFKQYYPEQPNNKAHSDSIIQTL